MRFEKLQSQLENSKKSDNPVSQSAISDQGNNIKRAEIKGKEDFNDIKVENLNDLSVEQNDTLGDIDDKKLRKREEEELRKEIRRETLMKVEQQKYYFRGFNPKEHEEESEKSEDEGEEFIHQLRYKIKGETNKNEQLYPYNSHIIKNKEHINENSNENKQNIELEVAAIDQRFNLGGIPKSSDSHEAEDSHKAKDSNEEGKDSNETKDSHAAKNSRNSKDSHETEDFEKMVESEDERKSIQKVEQKCENEEMKLIKSKEIEKKFY